MKYTYAYKTSDGVRHEDSMNAASREEVFAELRKKGIKAIKVVAADGSKANGEVRGVRKRIVAVIVTIAALCVGIVSYFGGTRTAAVQGTNSTISPRHQIYGDPAIMEALERGDFSAALSREGDRLLAVFAQPGKLMCAKGIDPRRLERLIPEANVRRVGDNAPYRNAAEQFAAYAKNELAADKDITIEGVALASGFHCLRSYNRAFLKFFGQSPGSYRRSYFCAK